MKKKLTSYALYQYLLIGKDKNTILINPLNQNSKDELTAYSKLLEEVFTQIFIPKSKTQSGELTAEMESFIKSFNKVFINGFVLIKKEEVENISDFLNSFLYNKKVINKIDSKKIQKEVKDTLEIIHSVLKNILFHIKNNI